MRGYFTRFIFAAIVMTAFLPGCGPGSEKGNNGNGSSSKGDEVRREVGETLEATREYLSESTEKLKLRFDKQMKSIDEGVEELKKRSAGAGEKGREYRDQALRMLEEKKAAASESMDEVRRSSGELRREASAKLDAAMKELEEAYERARKSFETQGQ